MWCARVGARCARVRAHARDTHSVSLWSLWAVVSSGSLCVGNELPCARINTVRSLTHIRFRGTHFMARRGARTHARSEAEIESISLARRGASRGGERDVSCVYTVEDRTRTCAHESS